MRMRLLLVAVLAGGVLLAFLARQSRQEPARPTVSPAASATMAPAGAFTLCATCHGPQGEGLEAQRAPRLAGQDPHYLASQLHAFRRGHRGATTAEPQAQAMAILTANLPEAHIQAALGHVQELPATTPPDRLFGDRLRGAELYHRNCSVCHGEHGEGMPAYHMPRLDHQHGWYLEQALLAYRQDRRGTHAEDELGRTMNFYAKLLPDDAAARDVAAWLSVVARQRAVAATP